MFFSTISNFATRFAHMSIVLYGMIALKYHYTPGFATYLHKNSQVDRPVQGIHRAQHHIDPIHSTFYDNYVFSRFWNLSTGVFQIHGLWPNYKNGSWPQYCCNTSLDVIDTLRSIQDALEPRWEPSLWQHEWDKHGTCFSSAQKDETWKTESVVDYFSRTLYLDLIYDLNHVTLPNQISIDAFEASTGTRPFCSKDSQLLSEARMLLYRNYSRYAWKDAGALETSNCISPFYVRPTHAKYT